LRWGAWGKEGSQWFRTRYQHQAPRYSEPNPLVLFNRVDPLGSFVSGSRFIHPSSDGQIKVTDFSQSSTGSWGQRNADGDGGGKREDADLYAELDLPPIPFSEREEAVREEENTDEVQPRTFISEMNVKASDYTGFLLDDHRILAYKVGQLFTGCGAELMQHGSQRSQQHRIKSLDVFCFI
jgi:hypothetical protein